MPDGLEAQIWECLRRNHAFKDALQVLDQNQSAQRDEVIEELANNEFSEIILRFVLEKTIPVSVTETPFNKLSPKIRKAIQAATDDLYNLPIRVYPPEIHGKTAPFSAEDQTILADLLKLWETHEVIAVPHIQLDETHRRKNKAGVANLVPTVSRFPLGAEQQWATFLSVEKHTRFGDKDNAHALAAWEHLEPASFRKFQGREFTSAGILEARRALKKQNREFIKRISAVDSAINKVYPRFAVFDYQRKQDR